MSEILLNDLKDEVADLRREIDRLTARLNEVSERLSAVAGPEDSTGKIKAAAPAFQPVAPPEAPAFGHGQGKMARYDDMTEKDRKLGNALDVLDSLGKIK